MYPLARNLRFNWAPPKPKTEDTDENFDHLDVCKDCKGSGKYVGFLEAGLCDACSGSGWVGKGQGWNKEELEQHKAARALLDRHGL